MPYLVKAHLAPVHKSSHSLGLQCSRATADRGGPTVQRKELVSMTNPIEISGDTVMLQAYMTAHDFLLDAKADAEAVLGKRYDRKHPAIVAGYVQTAAIDGGRDHYRAAGPSGPRCDSGGDQQ
jgi:hypothetical protein